MTAHILGELWSAFAKSHNIDFELHRLVFLILLTMFLNIANLVPDRLKAGAKRMQTFFSKHTILDTNGCCWIYNRCKRNYSSRSTF